jgi:two-component system, cell cycle sensor histidine kinase and response regulator CckA
MSQDQNAAHHPSEKCSRESNRPKGTPPPANPRLTLHELQRTLAELRVRQAELQKQNDALRRFPDLARSALEAWSWPVALVDGAGVIELANSAWHGVTGPEAAVRGGVREGHNYLEVCARAAAAGSLDAARIGPALRDVLDGGRIQVRVEGPWTSSAEPSGSTCVTRLPGEGPPRVLIAHEPAAEARQTDAALRAREARFHTIVDFTCDWEVWENADGTPQYVSPACSRITGYSAAEFLAAPGMLDELVLEDDRAAWAAHRRASNAAPGPHEVQFRIRRRDGAVCWIEHVCQPVRDPDGTVVGYRASNRDVTQRRTAEEAVRQSEAFARAALDGLSAHIAIVNESGVIESVNRAWRDFAAANGLVGGNVCEGADYLGVCARVSGEQAQPAADFAQALRDVLDGRRDAFESEYPCHAPGRRRWFLARITRFPGAGPARAVIAHEDISERKRAETALRNERDLAIQLNAAGSLRDVFEHIVAAAVRVEGVDVAGIYVTDADGGLHLQARAGLPPESAVADAHEVPPAPLQLFKLPGAGGVPGPDLAAEAWGKERVRAAFCVPIQHEGCVVAVVNIGSRRLQEFSPGVRQAVEAIARQAGNALRRRQAEESLRLSEEQFRTLAANVPGVTFRSQVVPPWRMHYCSEGALALTGYPAGDFMTGALTYAALVHPEDMAPLEEAVSEAVAAQRPFVADHRIRHADGQLRWVNVHGRAVYDPDGIPIWLDGVILDVSERKAAENAVQESAALYDALLSTTVDGVTLVDADGRILEANEAICRRLGYRREELVGLSIADIEAVESPEDTACRMRKIMATGSDRFETRHRCRDGQIIESEVSVTFIPQRNCFVTFSHDVTERKRTEARLKFQALVLDQIGDQVTSTDLDGRITYVNEAECRFRGRSPESLIGGPVTIYGDAALRGAAQQEIIDRTRSAGGWSGEVVNFDKDGREHLTFLRTRLLHDAHGRPTGMCGVSTDVTELKQAERELRRAKERLELAQRAAGMGTWDWDLLTGGIEWTPDLFEIFGLDPQTTAASFEAWRAAVHPDDRAVAEARIRRAIQDHTPLASEYRVVRSDGQVCWVNALGHAVYDDTGKALRMLGVCIDVTERKQAAQALEDALLRQAAAVQAGNVGLWDWDLRTNEVRYSAEWKRQIGYTEDEIGEGFEEWRSRLHPDDFLRTVAYIETMIAEGRAHWQHEFRFRHKDGSYRWILAQAAVLKDETGQPIRTLGSHVDITDRKQAEEAVRESETRYRLLFDQMLTGFALHEIICAPDGTPEDYRFLAVNPAFERLTGLRAAQVVGRTAREVLPGLESRWIEVYGRVALTGEPAEFESTSMPLGKTFEVRAFSPAPRQFATIFADVTARKRAEDDLAREHAHLQLAQQIARLGYWSYDVDTKTPTWSEEMFRIFGRNPADGVPHYDRHRTFIHPDDWDRFDSAVQSAIQGTGYDLVIRVIFPDQSVHFVSTQGYPQYDSRGRFVGLFGTSQDITESKQREESRVRLATAVEQADEAIVITDAAGTIEYVNPAFEKITGYPHTEAVGQNPRILKSGRQDAASYRKLWSTITAGGVWHGRFTNRRKDGTLYDEEATISPIVDTSGKIVNFVAVKRDISQELALGEQLRQAQKMEMVGQLAAGVAHDFNNLLTAIHGYVSLARRGLPAEHPARDSLQGIEVAALHAVGVTRGLLTFSGRGTTQREAVDLRAVLRDSTRLLRRLLPARVILEVDAPAEPAVWVRADPTQLQQVVMNLALNARDAMPEGGCLRIALGVVFQATAAGRDSDCDVWIAVSDTGAGMTPEVQAHIFEPFFTTKPAGRGTGLGLAIVRSIVQEHGGRIEVASSPEAGSTFRVFLPCVTPPPTASPAVPLPVRGKGEGELVLLAEDDPYVRQVLATALQNGGYGVIEAKDGAELSTLYLKHREKLRLLVVDVDLPRQSGLDGLAAIRAGGDAVPAIVITAQAEVPPEALGRADVLMRKPFSIAELARVVNQLVVSRGSEEDPT